MISICNAQNAQDIELVRQLFTEYAESLGFSLCFQGFDKELAGLPGEYAQPSGRLLLAFSGEKAAGCVGLHRLGSNDVCEMKRLYVRPEFREKGMGKQLMDAVIAQATEIGYKKMRLDTITGKMQRAIDIYRAYGFREIPSYRENPIEGVIYMELDLPIAHPANADS